MNRIKNNKGFTLVELLAVIVVLAIVMSLAVVAITGVLDNARKATFVSEAKSFLEGARNVVNSEELVSVLDSTKAEHLVSCGGANPSTEIQISEIPLQQGGKKSPYGNNYTDDSFVRVTARMVDNVCTYNYSIFLSDSVYRIGTKDLPDEWSTIDTSSIKLVSQGNN